MDPSTPEFRPRVCSTDSQQTPMSDAKWRTTCRTCGANFKSRNQLMRHLYKTHPLKPGKLNATSREVPNFSLRPQSAEKLTSPILRATVPRSEQSQIHPFILLPEDQKLVFVARVLFAMFTMCMRQIEEERARQQNEQCRGESQNREQSEDHQKSQNRTRLSPQDFILPPSEDAGSAIPIAEAQSTSQPATGHGHHSRAIAPDQIYQGGVKDDSESEDSDDEDGGVALSEVET
ncbi:hypothetical protein N657DRAFT_629219 [Parathielavia appendiculata]|uniref:C2H2-type domain-containing protein n=1 Tax=Parathielavia appendiculata TaxID=2587402 RepID=A0AAN6U8P0_9PEZI|nr:hypothetical protein N657DRAFT_629219 [Parathielavia appendiculata]